MVTEVDGKKSPSLWLIGAPLGNPGDLSPRARELLAQVDVLYCEDTRRTGLLLQSVGIRREGPIFSFFDHSPNRVLQKVREHWACGESVGYVTDAGMPGVSDPGFELVRLAEKTQGVLIRTAPGPSAVTTFFSLAGLEAPKFLFHGFFPRTRGEIEKVLEQVSLMPVVHIFFESPARIEATMDILGRHEKSRPAAVAREMTKPFEECWRGSVEEVAQRLRSHVEAEGRPRGEYVFGLQGGPLVEAGHGKGKNDARSSARDHFIFDGPEDLDAAGTPVWNPTESQAGEIADMMRQGLGSKEVSKALSKKWGISRRELYDYIVKKLT